MNKPVNVEYQIKRVNWVEAERRCRDSGAFKNISEDPFWWMIDDINRIISEEVFVGFVG